MGVCSSRPATKVLPPLTSAMPPESRQTTPGVSEPSVSASSAIGPTVSGDSNLVQGHHWAEGSPGKERRIAQKPWEQAVPSIAEGDECAPCDTPGRSLYDFNCTFPMMVMKVETFMELKRMKPYEQMIKKGEIFEWTPDMGKVFFLSHQWTSFSHPDPQSEQLEVAQGCLKRIAEGNLRSIFATKEEWEAFHYKEANRFLNFAPVEPEQMAEDVKSGYVWLDYASVPQAADAEESRLRAIDSIPFYVDHALCFLAIVPKIEHKDLPGTFCTYKSWMERGWCRLENQVHELRLFATRAGEMMPGMPNLDLPMRPLIVHSASYATTYDMMDNFYMLWQRKASVFTGEFACCRLGHKRKNEMGEKIDVTCDKTRIRPLVRALWERKIAHLREMPGFVRWLFHWRWASHTDIMMSDFAEDTSQSEDVNLKTLEDICGKYMLDQTHLDTFTNLMQMMGPMFYMHPSFSEPEGTPVSGGSGAAFKPQMEAWFARWAKAGEDLKTYQLAWAVAFMVAEGNLTMLKKLVDEHGADLTYGYSWGITLLDFAAGKGHTRIIEFLLERGATGTVDKPSFRERITAIDRACKAGFVDVLDLLVDKGAILTPMRLNRQTPAHGAALMGHANVLRRLHELGADVVAAYDQYGKSPLDYSVYFCHKDASEFLRSLLPPEAKGLTKHEQAKVDTAVIKLQAMRRGKSARLQVNALRSLKAKATADKPAEATAAERAAGALM